MENLRVGPVESFVRNEQSKSFVDKTRKEDILDHRMQQIVRKEALLDSTFSKAKIVVESNHNKAIKVSPSSAASSTSRLQVSDWRVKVALPTSGVHQ